VLLLNMIKSDLVKVLSLDFTAYSEKVIQHSVNDLVTAMINAMRSKQRIEIRGFGSFALRHRPSRAARNPKSGEALMTLEKYLPHFKPGKALRVMVDEQKK
jgi:integration host factor subunit beta